MLNLPVNCYGHVGMPNELKWQQLITIHIICVKVISQFFLKPTKIYFETPEDWHWAYNRPPDKSVLWFFFLFLIQIYTVSTQKNWLNEMALLSTKSSYSNV